MTDEIDPKFIAMIGTGHIHELVLTTRGHVDPEFGYDNIEEIEVCILCGKEFPEVKFSPEWQNCGVD
jgi:hypothetical protein